MTEPLLTVELIVLFDEVCFGWSSLVVVNAGAITEGTDVAVEKQVSRSGISQESGGGC